MPVHKKLHIYKNQTTLPHKISEDIGNVVSKAKKEKKKKKKKKRKKKKEKKKKRRRRRKQQRNTSLKSFEDSLTVDIAIVAASSKGYLKDMIRNIKKI